MSDAPQWAKSWWHNFTASTKSSWTQTPSRFRRAQWSPCAVVLIKEVLNLSSAQYLLTEGLLIRSLKCDSLSTGNHTDGPEPTFQWPVGYVSSLCWPSDASSCWGWVVPVLAIAITLETLWARALVWKTTPSGLPSFLLSLRANLTAVLLICNRAFSLVYVLCFWSGVCNLYHHRLSPLQVGWASWRRFSPFPGRKTDNTGGQWISLGMDIRFTFACFSYRSSILPQISSPFHFDLLIQFEYVSQHLVFANCIPLILKFFNQNILSYITAKNRYGLWTPLISKGLVWDDWEKLHYFWACQFCCPKFYFRANTI